MSLPIEGDRPDLLLMFAGTRVDRVKVASFDYGARGGVAAVAGKRCKAVRFDDQPGFIAALDQLRAWAKEWAA